MVCVCFFKIELGVLLSLLVGILDYNFYWLSRKIIFRSMLRFAGEKTLQEFDCSIAVHDTSLFILAEGVPA